MAGIRFALVLMSAERYIGMLVSVGATIITARLLTPAEFGISVLGSSVLGILEVTRDLGTSNYLVQQKDLTAEKIRTAFTVTLLLTVFAACVLVIFAPHVEAFYGEPGLALYFDIVALGFLTGPFVVPSWALFRRDMAFATIFSINTITLIVNSGVTIVLAKLGFSFMSFAWAGVASGTVGLVLYLFLCPNLSIFRPSFAEWRSVISFGTYDCGTSLLYKAWETLPYLIFGRVLTAEAVGLYQRATTLCKLPESTLLGSVWIVVLPAFAERAREGHSLKESYLKGLEYVTSLLWPSLLVIVCLAHPIVSVLLGRQWLAVVPLVQIIAGASLFSFPLSLSSPTLMAVGAMRHRLILALFLGLFSLGAQSIAAFHSLQAVAMVMFLTMPVSMCAAISVVRIHVPFHWSELAAALRKSAIVAAMSAAGPLLVEIVAGSSSDVSVGGAAIALALAAIGWILGVWLTDHPFLHEISRGRGALLNSAIAQYASRLLWR